MQGHKNTYLSKLRRPFVEDAEHYKGEGWRGSIASLMVNVGLDETHVMELMAGIASHVKRSI
jgi:hypothetical protein